ncbi:hypothetical protein D0Z00_001735 [Geotrichum galactomycetum]|uniref:Uncharacterized protein n=1 Tax=Geotrichum galactomycetum TaxID=27317 RepID=A0ACB6V686_9ASCO|nr:hypothetical protein D0Z00_001735 [Geotrichum candidum]
MSTTSAPPLTPQFPPLTKAHVDNCQFSAWQKQYVKLYPKSRVVAPLPAEFVDYLLADGISLPKSAFNLKYDVDEDMDLSTNAANDEETSDDDDEIDFTKPFKDLHNEINRIIKDELNGAVMPKLNWSAPKDSVWISTTNTLKCHDAYEIYMLLKASSYIVHDLTESYTDCVDYDPTALDGNGDDTTAAAALTSDDTDLAASSQNFELVLRQWVAVNPALEFRCFVHNRALIGITQRDMNYYDFLSPLQDRFAGEIEQFFEENLQNTFADPDFVFDVYVPAPYDRVWLVDINPFAPRTDSLLFAWEELLAIDPTDPEFEYDIRLQERENASRTFGGTVHSENYVPKDIVDASLTGEGIAKLAKQWQSMMNMEDPGSDSD